MERSDVDVFFGALFDETCVFLRSLIISSLHKRYHNTRKYECCKVQSSIQPENRAPPTEPSEASFEKVHNWFDDIPSVLPVEDSPPARFELPTAKVIPLGTMRVIVDPKQSFSTKIALKLLLQFAANKRMLCHFLYAQQLASLHRSSLAARCKLASDFGFITTKLQFCCEMRLMLRTLSTYRTNLSIHRPSSIPFHTVGYERLEKCTKVSHSSYPTAAAATTCLKTCFHVRLTDCRQDVDEVTFRYSAEIKHGYDISYSRITCNICRSERPTSYHLLLRRSRTNGHYRSYSAAPRYSSRC